MSAKAFLNSILEKKRDATARGWRLELIILPLEFENILFRGAVKEDISPEEYEIADTGVFIHGVPVMWSEKRLPKGQCWFRYGGQKE